jgi:hypothetical protein
VTVRRSALLTAFLAAGCLLALSACAGGASDLPAAWPGHGTLTVPETRAQREAYRLMSLLQLPGGATRLDSAPKVLTGGPALGMPGSSSVVKVTGYWQVPMSYDATLGWLQGHRPVGLVGAGSSSSSGPSGDIAGIGWADPHRSTVWNSAQLELGIAAGSGAGSGARLVRVDALVEWLDPVPLRDSSPGRRIHVDVAAGCPVSERGVAGVSNDGRPELSSALVPAAAPSVGLVCVYAGGNGRAFALRSQQRLDAAAARALAADARGLRLSHPDGGPISCPVDFGAAALVVFGYPHGPDVDLWQGLGGCGGLGNGVIRTSFSGLHIPAASKG